MTPKEESERLDVVDEHDRLVSTADRETVHRERLFHRAVHVFVLNPAGDIYLQKRAWSKSQHPGRWDSSASGHVESGESYPDAAVRELEEELGIRMSMEFVCKVPACDDTDREHSMLFKVRLEEGQPRPEPNPAEILEGRFYGEREIDLFIQQEPDRFTPSFRELFKRYLAGR